MPYAVKEIYATLQGEGYHTGRPAVFMRFAGCNLWSGREEDRATAVCDFCDTDFIGTDGPGGGSFDTPRALADAVASCWNGMVKAAEHDAGNGLRMVVCTGGEPLLQLDEPAVDALHDAGFQVAVETNGTKPAPAGLDWITVSPKVNAPLVLTGGHELKLVYPQPSLDPAGFEDMAFDHFFLQPMDGPNASVNTQAAAQYCMANPRWRLSLQTHKLIGLP